MASVVGQVELLSESDRTRVVRLYLPDGTTVIRKEPLGPNRDERLRHELEILRHLAGVSNVVQLAQDQPDDGALLLRDVHGVSLAHVPTPMEIPRLIVLALDLARAVAAVHQRGVVHCDINPGNILIEDATRLPYLIDFAIAITFAELHPEFTHHKEIVGTLPYLAPEQTGRTGRSVDRRSDLYGLGATLYELATGRPPFGVGDPLRLIHDHLARAAAPPATVNSAVPGTLSDVIMHLLEKEPDNRYQTAEGLIRDLEQVHAGARRIDVGEDDVPVRLTKPSRLVGREQEIEVLRASFGAALSGQCRRVVVSGGTGVGKSALINELRPIATAGDGWFTYGRFDRYRKDPEHDGIRNAMRGLCRLLLAEPEESLDEIHSRLLPALGPNAAAAAASIPEFATILRVTPDPGDPLTAMTRARESAVTILRAVASRRRPVVFVVDDVQWAGESPLDFIDHILSGEAEIEGLLFVVAYRDSDVHEAHPLAPLLDRWFREPGVEHLHIGNLSREDLGAMIGEMLHAPVSSVSSLVDPIFDLTGGNPHETVEMLGALRRDGVLRPRGAGWWWDPETLRRRLAKENLAALMRARVDAMPAPTRHTIEAVACIGSEVDPHALEVALGLSPAMLQQRLAPALEDGLLVVISGGRSIRFEHDRMHEIVLSGIPPIQLRTLRLSMARRLASAPEWSAIAADQYLSVVDAVHDPLERRRAAELLRETASQSMLIGESLTAERMLAAAVQLCDEPAMLIDLNTARHAALVRLGRLAEADEVYDMIVSRVSNPYDRANATAVQISSLTSRNRPEDAIAVGLGLLEEIGWHVPPPDRVDDEIVAGLDWSSRWIHDTDEQSDLSRPEATDPAVAAAGTVTSRMMPACFFTDQVTMSWLAIETTRAWREHGPARTLLGAMSHLPWALVARREAYHTGYLMLRRLLAVGEARGYEPDLSQTRFLYALGLCHWFHPLEEAAAESQRAREGLIRGGDLQTACYTFCTQLYAPDLSATVDDYAAEVESALAFTVRTGNEHARGVFEPFRWLVGVLRGERSPTEGQVGNGHEATPMAQMTGSVARALAGALFDDATVLSQHAASAMARLPVVEATYAVWQAHLLYAISLADQAHHDPQVLDRLDGVIGWMAQRAADMPSNFQHLVSLVEAERAWAVRDFRTAIQAFDAALRDAGHRPWHRAFIAERAAKFMLANGLDRIGWSLLVEAREAYRTWGARAKVDQLDRAYPSLDVDPGSVTGHATRRSSISAGAIDMLGILDAARALSSETSINALRAKVIEVLSAMTGATNVDLLLWNAERGQWVATADEPEPPPGRDHRHRVPQSIIRYVERTREPLVVGDATRDDRFSRDPYFLDLHECSVLAVPVLSRGKLQAILLLENRLIRNAFPVERLEVVTLIAGQLAVSLDNAQIYGSLERKVADRTRQLASANERLEQLSITDPLTGLANRRRMAESLREEWLRAKRTRRPLSLAMVDIDHFKQYNDLHGHRAGDRCLQHVAMSVDHNVRSTDLVARYGGEEFAIIMPDTDATAAWEAAERVRIAVAELAEPLRDNEVVTVSIGVATIVDADLQSTDQLIEQADIALYRAKRAGRNRVVSAPAERPE